MKTNTLPWSGELQQQCYKMEVKAKKEGQHIGYFMEYKANGLSAFVFVRPIQYNIALLS